MRELDPDIKRLVMAIAKGTASPVIEAQLIEWEAEKARLVAERAALEDDPKVVDFHPGVLESYRRLIEDLENDGLDAEARTTLGKVLRRAVARIEVLPG